jgi:hypothetical protein
MSAARWRGSFVGGAVVAVVAVGALLLGLPNGHAEGSTPVVALHAVDYSYQGAPGKLAPGEARVSFANDSKTEGHEMELFRINDGVNESLDQILAEEEANQKQQGQAGQSGGQSPPAEQKPPPPKMTFFAATGAGPGETAKMDIIGNLPAGRYGMVCFLSVGGDEANGPMYKKGMKAEFTVQ